MYELMKQITTSNIQFQKNVSATIQDLQTQIGQLATTVSQLQQQGSGNTLAQPIINPKENVNAITLKSDRELPNPTDIHLPFPSRSIPAKKVELNYDLLENFRRVEVNISFLDAIKQIPKYTKFLKDLCTLKRKLKGNEQVKRFHDSRIPRKEFHISQKWDGPFVITNVFSHGAVKIKNEVISKVFKVNSHQLKLFYQSPQMEEEFVADLSLVLPILCYDVP
ncbi:hypothetical protein HKD37_06G016631 [Glycine soja]